MHKLYNYSSCLCTVVPHVLSTHVGQEKSASQGGMLNNHINDQF